MRTTLDLDEALIRQALAVTKLSTKTAVIEEGLRGILRREAARRLIAMGGSDPRAKAGRRRRAV